MGLVSFSLSGQFGVIQRHVKKEFEAGNGRIERDGGNALINQVQLIAPQVFDGGGVG